MISIIVHILIIAAIFILVFRKISRLDDQIIFSTFLFLKISCGVLVGLLYWSYYGGTGDTVYFFEQAQALFQYFQTNKISFSEWVGLRPLSLSLAEFSAQSEPRTFFFVRVMSFLYAFTQGNYFSMSVYLSFFAGLATWAFVYEMARISAVNKLLIYTALLFIPSLTFWSSGLLKESLMVTALYSSGFVILKWKAKASQFQWLLPLALSLLILWKLKYYVPIVLVPVLVLTLIFSQNKYLAKFTFSKRLVLYFGLLIVGGLALAFIHPVFHSGRFFELIRISHDVISQNSREALIHFKKADSDLLFFILNLPQAWLTGIFRPFLWESFSAFSFLWSIEKAIFTALTGIAIFLSHKLKFSENEKWWGIAILIYASVLSCVVTLATPNFGSLVRYEVAYMPFLWLLVLSVINKHKHNSK